MRNSSENLVCDEDPLMKKAGAWPWMTQTSATFSVMPRDDAGLMKPGEPLNAGMMELNEATTRCWQRGALG